MRGSDCVECEGILRISGVIPCRGATDDPRRSVASVEKQAIDGTEIILVEEAPVERDRWRIGA